MRMRELEVLLSMLPAIAFEGGDAMTVSKLQLQLERPGVPIAQADLLIAAQALNRGWTVVTSNVRHFVRTRAPLIDWRVSDEIVEFPHMITRPTGEDED